jgi:hypothetical protein
MAITITNSVNIQNTTISINNVYVRLIFVAKANGTDVEVELIPYESKEKYDESLQINNTNLPRTISGQVTNQNLEEVHILVKEKLEELGFEVEIQLV